MKLKFNIWLLLSALLSVVLAIDLTFSYQTDLPPSFSRQAALALGSSQKPIEM